VASLDPFEGLGSVNGQVRAFGHVSAEEPVGVLVRACCYSVALATSGSTATRSTASRTLRPGQSADERATLKGRPFGL
jgi:hypothetical protein